MDINQVHLEFDIEVDKVDSLATANFEAVEKDVFINTAMEEFIKTRMSGNNVYKKGLESTEKRMQDLSSLISTAVVNNPVSDPESTNYEESPEDNPINPNDAFYYNRFKNKYDGFFIRLPKDFMFAIQEEAEVFSTQCGEGKKYMANVRPIAHDELNHIRRDPYKKPNKDVVYRLTAGTHDGFRVFELVESYNVTINKYFMRYIKYPKQVSLEEGVTIELPEHTHREIIQIAAANALRVIESQRYPSNLDKLNRIE